MILAILLSLSSSLFWQTEDYVMDNYDTITHNIPCEEVNSVCFQKSKVEFVKFDFLDNVNYSETHYYTNKVEYRYNVLKKYYSKRFEAYDTLDYGLKYAAFSDSDFDYVISVDTIPYFIGKKGNCVSVKKVLRYFR